LGLWLLEARFYLAQEKFCLDVVHLKHFSGNGGAKFRKKLKKFEKSSFSLCDAAVWYHF
jgi:hypothetical protein